MNHLLFLFSFFLLTNAGSTHNLKSNYPAPLLQHCVGSSVDSIENYTTFIVVRHAEKQKEGKDPELNEDGKKRANDLAFFLGKLNIAAVYSTPYNRTRQTVKPLAEQMKIPITEYAATMPYDQLIQQISEAHPRKIVVIAGHSNTVPEILKVLSKNTFSASIDESEYDNLFIVTVGEKEKTSILNLRYGDK